MTADLDIDLRPRRARAPSGPAPAGAAQANPLALSQSARACLRQRPTAYRQRQGPGSSAAMDTLVAGVVRVSGDEGLDRLEGAIARHRSAHQVRTPVTRAVDRIMGGGATPPPDDEVAGG